MESNSNAKSSLSLNFNTCILKGTIRLRLALVNFIPFENVKGKTNWINYEIAEPLK